ncbi:hypothetical protein [Desulfurispira natronophila]|uniref:Uncharacterized protein n=1 Tax=Desulfurispira natronophila TaxID=682562 RepID=A0A7W7Y612_9BACT|nr:hypothetical protein [Desulfurispira natronophila]MBB5022753.1 hypothetical protein [Desulfurispira natronophila]
MLLSGVSPSSTQSNQELLQGAERKQAEHNATDSALHSQVSGKEEGVRLSIQWNRSTAYFRQVLEGIQDGLTLVRSVREHIAGEEGLQNSLLRLQQLATKAASGRELTEADQQRINDETNHLFGYVGKLTRQIAQEESCEVALPPYSPSEASGRMTVFAKPLNLESLGLDAWSTESLNDLTTLDANKLAQDISGARQQVRNEYQRLGEQESHLLASLHEAGATLRPPGSLEGLQSAQQLSQRMVSAFAQDIDAAAKTSRPMQAGRVEALVE